MLLRLIQTMSSLSEISVDTNDDDSSNALTTRTADLTCDLTWDFLCIYTLPQNLCTLYEKGRHDSSQTGCFYTT